MEYKEPASIEIRPYDKAWKIDNTLYSIGNFTLPRGIAIRQIGFFVLALFLIAFLSTLIPPLAAIPGILLYVIFPVLISIFLLRYKMDGMSPHKFLLLGIWYLLTKGQYIEGFKVYPRSYNSTAKFRWYCSRGPFREPHRGNRDPDATTVTPTDIVSAGRDPRLDDSHSEKVAVNFSTQVVELPDPTPNPVDTSAPLIDLSANKETPDSPSPTLGSVSWELVVDLPITIDQNDFLAPRLDDSHSEKVAVNFSTQVELPDPTPNPVDTSAPLIDLSANKETPDSPSPTLGSVNWELVVDSPTTIDQNDCPFLDRMSRENLDCGSCIFHDCKHHGKGSGLIEKVRNEQPPGNINFILVPRTPTPNIPPADSVKNVSPVKETASQ